MLLFPVIHNWICLNDYCFMFPELRLHQTGAAAGSGWKTWLQQAERGRENVLESSTVWLVNQTDRLLRKSKVQWDYYEIYFNNIYTPNRVWFMSQLFRVNCLCLAGSMGPSFTASGVGVTNSLCCFGWIMWICSGATWGSAGSLLRYSVWRAELRELEHAAQEPLLCSHRTRPQRESQTRQNDHATRLGCFYTWQSGRLN